MSHNSSKNPYHGFKEKWKRFWCRKEEWEYIYHYTLPWGRVDEIITTSPLENLEDSGLILVGKRRMI